MFPLSASSFFLVYCRIVLASEFVFDGRLYADSFLCYRNLLNVSALRLDVTVLWSGGS